MFTYKLIYPAAGHVVTGNLKFISDSRIRNVVSKGHRYRYPSYIDFNRYTEEFASARNDFGDHRYKRERLECNALMEC